MSSLSSLRAFADQVRAAADIVEVVGQYAELKRAGANMKACCPFHQEKTPSFNVHPGKQIFKCFGCGKGGDVISFVREIERVDFREALEILARKYGLEVPKFQARDKDDEELRWRQTLGEVLEHAAAYYKARLAHPDQGAFARRYLTERGLQREIIETFGLGVASSEGEALARHLTAKGYSQKTLVEAGVAANRKSGEGIYDYLRDRLIFPILDARGKVIAFGGRIFEGDGPKYLNTPETPLFQKGRELYGLSHARDAMTRLGAPAVLVEGYMDVIACHQAGVKSAVASMGTSLTPDQARLIRRYAPEAVFLYDADEAGIKATLRGVEILVAANLAVRIGRMPAGEDPDSLAKKGGPEALQKVVADAVPFFDFLVAQARQRFDLSSPEESVRALSLFEPVLSVIAEPLVYEGYVAKLATELGHQEDKLRAYLEKHRKPLPRHEAGGERGDQGSARAPRHREAEEADGFYPESPQPSTGDEEALLGAGPPSRREMGLLHILMDHADARVLARDRLKPEWLTHPLVRYWAQAILNLEETGGDVWQSLVALCQSPAHEAFLHSAAFSADEPVEEDYLSVADHLMDLLEAEHRRTENSRLHREIHELYRSGRKEDLDKAIELQSRNFQERTRERHRATKENPCVQVKHT
jgi:DNA primase